MSRYDKDCCAECSQQILGFPCKIERKIRFLPILAVAMLRKAQCMFGMMVCNISFKRRGRLILAAFGFHGNDFCSMLQDKINLTGFIRIISGSNFKLSSKLLQNIILRQRTFKLIVRFQKNRTVVNARHVLAQPGVKNKELELPLSNDFSGTFSIEQLLLNRPRRTISVEIKEMMNQPVPFHRQESCPFGVASDEGSEDAVAHSRIQPVIAAL